MISNDYNDLESQIDERYKLETLAGWLEIDSETLPGNSCFFDTAECPEGFTIQFWFKTVECTEQVR